MTPGSALSRSSALPFPQERAPIDPFLLARRDATARVGHHVRRDRAGPISAYWVGLAFVIGAHLALIALLLQYEPARSALTSLAPIMVDLVTPPRKPEAPPPPPPPPPPRPQPKARPDPPKTIEPPPLITAAPTAETTLFAVPIAAPAPPAPAVEVVEAFQPPAPPAPPAPVTPPSFNAAYLHNEAPAYPVTSRRFGEQGRVLFRVLVNVDGTPGKVELRQSSGHDRLDTAALDAVRKWKFVPAHQAGQPVAAWVLVPIAFTLDR